MNDEVIKNVRIGALELISVNAQRKKVIEDEPRKYRIKITAEPKLENDTDTKTVFSCLFSVSFSEGEGPFTMEVVYEITFIKLAKIDAKTLEESFSEIAYPLLAKFSLLAGSITDAMRFPPLMLSPSEMQRSINEKEE